MAPANWTGAPVRWGNMLYVNLNVGESFVYEDKTVKLEDVQNATCLVRVDGEAARLTVARRALPTVVGGVRVFLANNRAVADLTEDRRSLLYSTLTGDALLCLSNPDGPLLDPTRHTFPIDRGDGYDWPMASDSHMFSYLYEKRAHEGIDLDLHEARGCERHAIVAVEAGTIRWIDTTHTDAHQACLLLESEAQPGLYYIYQHLNEAKLLVASGEHVAMGQGLGYIWGDMVWGHLHFAISGSGPLPTSHADVYAYELNAYPALYELWHGDLAPHPRVWHSGHFLFDRYRAGTGNAKRLNAYADCVGYGWCLGDWNPTEKVESAYPNDWGTNARLRKTLFEGLPAEATNPDDHYCFEVNVAPGTYEVRALVGDGAHATCQHLSFNGIGAGEWCCEANAFSWTPAVRVPCEDGTLIVRIDLDGDIPAGLAELVFARRDPPREA